MRNEFTAVIEKDGDWYIAYCAEIPGANGQGKTIEECKQSLAAAISLILEDRREDSLRGVPEDAIRDVVSVVCNDMFCSSTYVDMVVTSNAKVVSILYGEIRSMV